MSINVLTFAKLQQTLGTEQTTLPYEKDDTPSTVFARLQVHYHIELESDELAVAVNEEFASWQTPLDDGDEVAFISPVAGG